MKNGVYSTYNRLQETTMPNDSQN